MESEERMEETGEFVRRFGTEVANYWKSAAIVLPVHQRMERAHLDYVAGSVLATEREWCGVPDAPGRNPLH
jgi:dTDP-4-amino-4,6-dideoxygalactose transaminase